QRRSAIDHDDRAAHEGRSGVGDAGAPRAAAPDRSRDPARAPSDDGDADRAVDGAARGVLVDARGVRGARVRAGDRRRLRRRDVSRHAAHARDRNPRRARRAHRRHLPQRRRDRHRCRGRRRGAGAWRIGFRRRAAGERALRCQHARRRRALAGHGRPRRDGAARQRLPGTPRRAHRPDAFTAHRVGRIFRSGRSNQRSGVSNQPPSAVSSGWRMLFMRFRRLSALCGALLLALSLQATGAAEGKGAASITPAELKDWLSYIASDELQGRQVFTEGLGLAGGYIADHLKEWGVKPAGDEGTYFQVVKLLGVSVKRNSSVTVTVNGQTRTFKDGEGVTFPANAGGRQTVTGTAEYVGYGLSLPESGIDDYKGRDVSGKVVLYVGRGPQSMPASTGFRILGARARNAIELRHAVAAIGPAGGFGRGGGGGRGGATTNLGDFQTVERLDRQIAPQITA